MNDEAVHSKTIIAQDFLSGAWSALNEHHRTSEVITDVTVFLHDIFLYIHSHERIKSFLGHVSQWHEIKQTLRTFFTGKVYSLVECVFP